MPGSASATTNIDGRQVPPPDPKFGGANSIHQDFGPSRARHSFVPAFAAIMGATALFATILHGIEVTMWALAYRFLGALSNNSAAMLYSLSAMTSYGHASIFLELHWQLMGALESLNGMIRKRTLAEVR